MRENILGDAVIISVNKRLATVTSEQPSDTEHKKKMLVNFPWCKSYSEYFALLHNCRNRAYSLYSKCDLKHAASWRTSNHAFSPHI